MIDLTALTTEKRNPNTMELDQMSPLEVLKIMNDEDKNTVNAVKQALPAIAQVVAHCTESIKAGGRIIYMGAGTSGRLGLLDAVECPPTFGLPQGRVMGLMAGGEGAFIKAVEGAEDNADQGVLDLKAIDLKKADTLIGIAASGRTPYVLGGMQYAKGLGCHVAAVVCNTNSAMSKAAQTAVELLPGPEVLTGSTRLKAGTAQKMALNMISTATMVGAGKVYKNLMVDVVQTNEKLWVRAQNILMEASGCTRERAKEALTQNKGSVKQAIVQIALSCTPQEAKDKLQSAGGFVRKALKE